MTRLSASDLNYVDDLGLGYSLPVRAWAALGRD
jgi:hypothetical protein